MTKTILIVEDDPFIALDLQDTFENEGFEVFGPVAAVDEALSLLERGIPDVAMLDYNLGRETSIPLAHQLDKISVPYIFVSGQVDRVVTGNDQRQQTVVSKPFDPDRLIQIIKDLITKNDNPIFQ
ncbi:MAG: response regulator [Hellea sp.]|nr:response regulator [Hellea sp.]